MNALILIPLGLLIVALVGVVWIETRMLRDEMTANRMERAELLQRIQAPDVAAQTYAYNQVRQEKEQYPDETALDNEWEKSDESLVPFDEDLDFAG